jgi:UDP-4-amino-4,6-dideoxy-N-acetyl-beta-L-altrosamine transaminase
MIPYGRQDITQEDIDAVVRTLKSDFLTQGPVIPELEYKLCKYTGARYSVAVNSCTSALHIACLALDLGPGDILWTSPISFVASANCALYCNATVDFVDINLDTALISIESLKEKLEYAEKEGKLPKIVIPVHFAGQPCNMEEIHTLSQQYGFKIIEDAAHAIGAKYQNNPVGNCLYSDITVFSFHPVKIITTGEGGAAMTNSSKLAEKMSLLRTHGITRDPVKMKNKLGGLWYYEQIDLGFNYRMTDIQAALGISQLKRLDQYILRRTEIAKWYDKKFKDVAVTPLMQKSDRSSAYHLYVILVGEGKNKREKLYNYLYEHNIRVNVHYIPIYRQAYYSNSDTLKVADMYYQRTISLPMFTNITTSELNTVVDNTTKHIGLIRQ